MNRVPDSLPKVRESRTATDDRKIQTTNTTPFAPENLNNVLSGRDN